MVVVAIWVGFLPFAPKISAYVCTKRTHVHACFALVKEWPEVVKPKGSFLREGANGSGEGESASNVTCQRKAAEL